MTTAMNAARAATAAMAVPRRFVSIVVHDVAPATQAACERLIENIRRVAGDAPLTLLVVPRYHAAWPAAATLADDPRHAAHARWLDTAIARGDELALHGFTHLDEHIPHRGIIDRWRRRWYTAGEGEFAALDAESAAQRIGAGVDWFNAHRWPLQGFVAPAWLVGAGCWQALQNDRTFPFRYTCTLTQLIGLPRPAELRQLASRSIVYSTRAAWRRGLSLPWNRWVASSQRDAPLLRFELHPADADHEAVRTSWMRLLGAAMRTREAVTLAEAVRRLLPAAEDRQPNNSNINPAVAAPVAAPASTSLG